jgi:hypothetical protein
MDRNVTALERAFQLAETGVSASVSDIKTQLKREGYSDAQIIGPTLVKQLKALIEVSAAVSHRRRGIEEVLQHRAEAQAEDGG